MTSTTDEPQRSPGEWLTASLVSRDFGSLSRVFSEHCRLRAFTPNNVFGSIGPEGAALAFRTWFGDATRIALVEHSIDSVSDRFRLRFLLDVTENGERTLVEQTGYFDVDGDKITDLTLVCSGNRPYRDPVDA